MGEADPVDNVPVLLAIEITEVGQKMVLDLRSGDKESAFCWREYIKDLKRRGLNLKKVRLEIMDRLSRLKKNDIPRFNLQICN